MNKVVLSQFIYKPTQSTEKMFTMEKLAILHSSSLGMYIKQKESVQKLNYVSLIANILKKIG